MKTQENSVEKLARIIEEKDRRIAELEKQVKWFLSQLSLSKHKQYGASSEQTDSNQISMFNEVESTADTSQPEPELTEVKTHYRRRTRLTTDKLPEDLPVVVIEHELPEDGRNCSACGKSGVSVNISSQNLSGNSEWQVRHIDI